MTRFTKSQIDTDFFSLQTHHNRKSILLFLLLCLFFIVCIVFFLLTTFGVFFMVYLRPLNINSLLLRLVLFGVLIATGITALNVLDAMRNGPSKILKRLRAEEPDPSDMYHHRFLNVTAEIALSAGIRYVKPFVIPDASINSMALLLNPRTPAIAVTEGMLSALTRDELQAVIAHELSHILSGDLHFITLVVSVMTTFERLSESTRSANEDAGSGGGQSSGVTAALATSGFLSYALIRLLSTMVSREREMKTDAQAIELSRNPAALATAVFKAYNAEVHLGDFSLAYSPVFIVSPNMSSDNDGFLNRLFDTHPPIEKRLKTICNIAGIDRSALPRMIVDQEHLKVTRTVQSLDEIDRSGTMIPILEQADLIIPDSTHSSSSGMSAGPGCPRCHVPLKEIEYEGTHLDSCPNCRGALVHPGVLMRILIRREDQFSDFLRQKARALRKSVTVNPLKTTMRKQWTLQQIMCPICRIPMNSRPYSYHHFVPVDRCYRCKRIWFDSDELEVLQILVEHDI